jgi:hypothetical protein
MIEKVNIFFYTHSKILALNLEHKESKMQPLLYPPLHVNLEQLTISKSLFSFVQEYVSVLFLSWQWQVSTLIQDCIEES